MVTRLSTNSVMVRERVAQLPGQAVEACHQAQDRLSLAEERPNTTGSSLAAKRKAFRQTYLSQPFARKSRLPLRQYRNYPDTRSPLANPKISLVPLSPPFVNVGFRAIICSSVYLKKGHFKILHTFQLLWDKKGKKKYL